MKRILKVNRHTAETICRLNLDDFRNEPEVTEIRRTNFATGNDNRLFEAPDYIYETKTYLYLWVRKPE